MGFRVAEEPSPLLVSPPPTILLSKCLPHYVPVPLSPAECSSQLSSSNVLIYSHVPRRWTVKEDRLWCVSPPPITLRELSLPGFFVQH